MLPARITLRLYPCPPLRARAAVSRLALALGTRRPARREFRRHAQRLDIVVSARNAISGAAVRSAAPEKDHVCGCCGAKKKFGRSNLLPGEPAKAERFFSSDLLKK